LSRVSSCRSLSGSSAPPNSSNSEGSGGRKCARHT
jgi:hypothetical protein